MLPEKLSNGLCSLNPEVERLAMVCDMLVSHDGEIEAYQFFPAVIRSAARFTYTEVAAILANTRGPEAARRTALVPHLLDLHDVYRALLKARVKRGAIDFETTETQIVCDENGRIEKIVPRTRNEAHRLIEESMLAANVCSADFIARAKHPALYRVHEGPTPEKKTLLQNYLKALGLGLSISDDPTPAEFQAIAAATKDRPDAQQIHPMLLRSMQQAIYTSKNIGHFGLAYEAYTHFTSPIRRYPDLLVHRVIKALLDSRRYPIGARAEDEPAKKARLARSVKSAKSAKAGAPARRCWCRAASSKPGRSPARTAAPTSGAPTRPRATSRPGSSAATCASTSARSSAARSARSRASACSSRSTASTSRAWCTSPNSAANTSASTRCARSCAASARACATSSARAFACRSAGSTSTAARSISAWSATAKRPQATCAASARRRATVSKRSRARSLP